MSEPMPVSEVDRHLVRVPNSTRLLAAMVALLTAAVVYLGLRDFYRQGELTSSCAFFGAIATASVPVRPAAAGPPSQEVIEIIAASRQAYRGRDCTPALPSPSAGLRHWASFYGIPIA